MNTKTNKSDTFSNLCVSSLRRGHVHLLCIVPMLSYETGLTPLTNTKRPAGPRSLGVALVAQWIEHQTCNLGVAGLRPARAMRKSFFGRGDGRVV